MLRTFLITLLLAALTVGVAPAAHAADHAESSWSLSASLADAWAAVTALAAQVGGLLEASNSAIMSPTTDHEHRNPVRFNETTTGWTTGGAATTQDLSHAAVGQGAGAISTSEAPSGPNPPDEANWVIISEG